MLKTKNLLLATVLTLSLTFAVAAPNEPFRLFGEITEDGDPVDLEGEIRYQNETIKQFETDSDGLYDITISNGEYEGEKLEVYIEGDNQSSIVFEPLGVKEENIDIGEIGEQDQQPKQEKDPTESDETLGEATPTTSTEDEFSEPSENTSENGSDTSNQQGISENQDTSIVEKTEDLGQVEEGSRIDVELGGSSLDSNSRNLESLSFSSTESIESGNITVRSSRTGEGSELAEKASEKPQGAVYSYTEVETNIRAENATFEFNVNRQYLNKHNATPEEVVKQRYNGQEWVDLETRYMEESTGPHKFEAESPNGFSLFATTIKTNQKEDSGEKITGQFLGQTSNFITAILIIIIGSLGAYIKSEA